MGAVVARKKKKKAAAPPSPPEELLGTGKKIRHIRIKTKEDLKLPLRPYIRAAIEQAIQRET